MTKQRPNKSTQMEVKEKDSERKSEKRGDWQVKEEVSHLFCLVVKQTKSKVADDETQGNHLCPQY